MGSVQRTYYGYYGSTAGIRFVVTYNYTDDVVTLSNSVFSALSVLSSVNVYRTWNVSGDWSNNQRGCVSLAITNGLGGSQICGAQTSGGTSGTVAWANNATLTLTPSGTWNTSSIFNANNRNSIEVEVPLGVAGWGTNKGIEAGDYDYSYICGADTYELLGITKTFRLNAPPIISNSYLESTLPSGLYYTDNNGVATCSIRVRKVSAQYSAYIKEATLTVGTLSKTEYDQPYTSMRFDVPIVGLQAGTYTPTLTITDTRGQTSTGTLSDITIIQYDPVAYDYTQVQSNTAGFFVNRSTASVTVDNIVPPTGVTLTSAELTIGSATDTITLDGTETDFTLSIPLATSGTFTPTLKIYDSRGTSETITLNSISVYEYSAPTISATVNRVTSLANPKQDDEGESMLITATFTFDPQVELVEPPVTANSETANMTWYETYDGTALSNAINWASYTPTSPVTIYGFSNSYGTTTDYDAGDSFQIVITPTDTVGVGTSVTASLPQAFFTIDFLAGGHGIAFGKLSTHTGFECAMTATFEDTVQFDDTATFGSDIYIDLSDYQTTGSVDKELYDAIVALGWDSDVLVN